MSKPAKVNSSNFPITTAMRLIKRDVSRMRKTTLNQIADTPQTTPYQILVSCIISLRTKDDVTHSSSQRLFAKAENPEGMVKLSEKTIAKLIYPAGFYNQKAGQIRDLSQTLLDDYNGQVPDTIEELIKFRGVGRKTANLVVTLGYGKPGICVDTHVHRITNRWKYIATKNPDQSEMALREILPKRYWIPINDLLVTWGQNICTPQSPHCSKCPLDDFCPKFDVDRMR